MEKEKNEAFNAVREAEEQETENELNNIQTVVANLQKELAFDPEVNVQYCRCVVLVTKRPPLVLLFFVQNY